MDYVTSVEDLTEGIDTSGIIFAGGDLWVDALGTIEGAIASGQQAASRIATT
jgi:monoamine oxidase